MKQSLISLSFDDGRRDTFVNGYPILKKYKLHATYNVTAGFIEGKCNDFISPNIEPMTEEMLRVLYFDHDMEIAGHGYYHKNTMEDIMHGISALCKMLDTDSLYDGRNGFASPNTIISRENCSLLRQNSVIFPISYIRLSLRYFSPSFLKVLARKASRVIKSPYLYQLAFKDTLMRRVDEGLLYSIPVLRSATVNQIHSVIKLAIKEEKACILMFHGIVKKENIRDNWDYDVMKFDKVCSLLDSYQNQGKIRVLTSMELYNLLKQ